MFLDWGELLRPRDGIYSRPWRAGMLIATQPALGPEFLKIEQCGSWSETTYTNSFQIH